MTDSNHVEGSRAALEDLRACRMEQIALEEEAAKIASSGASKTEYLTSPEYLEIVDRNHRLGTRIDQLQVQLEYHTGMVSLEVAVATIRYYNYNGDPNTPGAALPAEGYIITQKG